MYASTPAGVAMGLAWTSHGGSSLYIETIGQKPSGEAKGGSLDFTGRSPVARPRGGSLAFTGRSHHLLLSSMGLSDCQVCTIFFLFDLSTVSIYHSIYHFTFLSLSMCFQVILVTWWRRACGLRPPSPRYSCQTIFRLDTWSINFSEQNDLNTLNTLQTFLIRLFDTSLIVAGTCKGV